LQHLNDTKMGHDYSTVLMDVNELKAHLGLLCYLSVVDILNLTDEVARNQLESDAGVSLLQHQSLAPRLAD
jgi:hypothetical protein